MTNELDQPSGFRSLFETLLQTGSHRTGWKPSRYRPPAPMQIAEIVRPEGDPPIVKAELRDIDSRGVRLIVSPMVALAEGDACTVRVRLDDERSYECHGTVRWVHHTADHQLVGITPDH